MKFHYLLGILIFVTISCTANSTDKKNVLRDTITNKQSQKKIISALPQKTKTSIGEVEQKFIDAGLINVNRIDSSIIVELRYASENNFVKTNVYGNINKCYLQKEVANKLVKAHNYLKQNHPELRFKIWDGARPFSVQKLFWKLIDKPEHLKRLYLARPDSTSGSLHNYGSAVDLTIVDTLGNEINMGTDFDHFSVLAYPIREQQLLAKGSLTQKIIDNRAILRKCMNVGGFYYNKTEWWHFSAYSRKKAKQKFKIIM